MHNLKTMTRVVGDRTSMMAWPPPMDPFVPPPGRLPSAPRPDASPQVAR